MSGRGYADIFLANAPEDRRARFASWPDLEAALASLAEAGQGAWPEIRVSLGEFMAFLGRSLPVEVADDIRALHARDLYLACAYGLGAPGAARVLEEDYMFRVEVALARVGAPPSLRADIQQELRERLVAMRAPDPARKGYAGRGELAAWLCVAAVRGARRELERDGRGEPLGDIDSVLLADDPEMAHVCETYKREFQAAFQGALASLTSRERNILRYHFIDGMSIDQIGLLYRVHRATAARWLVKARESLCSRTREQLASRVPLSEDGFQRILALIGDQISLRMSSVREDR